MKQPKKLEAISELLRNEKAGYISAFLRYPTIRSTAEQEDQVQASEVTKIIEVAVYQTDMHFCKNYKSISKIIDFESQ